MELALRRGFRRWPGLGQSGETDTEGVDLPTGSIDFSSGEVDPSTYYPAPGSTLETTPGVELTPAELAAEQTRASAWLATIPGALSIAGKVALTAAQISAGVAAGNLKPSSTCPSGYLVAGGGQCVTAPTGTTGGISNTTLAIGAIAFLFLMMASGGGGRRR